MIEDTIQISRINRVDGETKIKAFVDILLGGLIIKGLRIVDGEQGLFVGMPSHQGKDGKWYDTVSPATKEIKQQLSEVILSAYKE